jgi:hypothetical protein
MEFDLGSMHPLVALMPEVMLVGTLLERYPEILPMLEAMAREARGDRAGFAASWPGSPMSSRRSWSGRGWNAAAGTRTAGSRRRDPASAASSREHRDPGRNWTLAEIAAEMAVPLGLRERISA